MKTMNLKYFGVKILIFRGHVTSSERDRRTRREIFPIGSQWWPCVYLARIRRYGASKILGSRVWPFGVTWRHRSRDHWTRHMWFPIGGQLEPCVYLAPLRRYKASKLHLPMLKAKTLTAHAPCHVTCRYGVQNDHIFGIPEAILPIQYTTSMGLRWRLVAVYRWNFLYRSVFGRKFLSVFGSNFWLWGDFSGVRY